MATYKEFLVSGDCHIIEPPDLFKTRLPANMRDRALWEEEFTLEEPIVPGGHTEFRKLHTIGFDGWTVSKYRQFEGHDGTTPGWIPDDIIADMDMEGVDAAVFFPNLALFVLFTDDHELSMAHSRAWNDWVAETYLQYKDRVRPVASIPLTDIPDAVAEIERAHKLGLRALMLPEIPPVPYWSRDYEPVWNVAEELGLPIFIHVATGGVMVKEDASRTGSTVKGMMTAMNMGKGQLTDDMVAGRTMGGGNTAAASPSKIMADLIGGGVPERHPGLTFTLVEFGASWLVSYMAFMDKSWRRGTGQDPKWWLGFWEEGKSPYEQPAMGRLFNINEKWPYPLKPTEYVRRQFHIQFADDPVAVQARHITGVSTVVWGNDYPHAEGTFNGTDEVIAEHFDSTVSDEDRAAILGGTLAKVAGFDTSRKLAVERHPADSAAS